jgi:hypothetical protein
MELCSAVQLPKGTKRKVIIYAEKKGTARIDPEFREKQLVKTQGNHFNLRILPEGFLTNPKV